MFADSSFWVGLVDSRDQWHRRAMELRTKVPPGVSVLDLTVAEVVTIVDSKHGGKVASEPYRFFSDSCRGALMDSELLDSSMDFHPARDGRLSVTDCATIKTMVRDGEKTILSFGSDFDSLRGIIRLH